MKELAGYIGLMIILTLIAIVGITALNALAPLWGEPSGAITLQETVTISVLFAAAIVILAKIGSRFGLYR